MLGGINAPSVPDAATTPVASPGSYFALSISGTASLDIAPAIATLEPLAAAKPALETLVGVLHLTDRTRLQQLLDFALQAATQDADQFDEESL